MCSLKISFFHTQVPQSTLYSSSDYYADDESEGSRHGSPGYGHGSHGNETTGRPVSASSELDEGHIRQDKKEECALGHDADVRHKDEHIIDSGYDADDKHDDEHDMDSGDNEDKYDKNAIAEGT